MHLFPSLCPPFSWCLFLLWVVLICDGGVQEFEALLGVKNVVHRKKLKANIRYYDT